MDDREPRLSDDAPLGSQGGLLGDALPLPPWTFGGTLTRKEFEAVDALLHGNVKREDMDRRTSSSNGPDIVARLRAKGIKVHMNRKRCLDRFGKPSWYGVYGLPMRIRPALRNSVAYRAWKAALKDKD